MGALFRSRLNSAQIRVIVAACGMESLNVDIQAEISVNMENQVEILILNKKFQECMCDIVFLKCCPNLFFFPHCKSLIFNITSFLLGPNIHRMFTCEGDSFHLFLFMFKYVIKIQLSLTYH